MEEVCALTKERAVCYHCGGNQEVGAKECESRKRSKSEVEKTRVQRKITYAEATKRVREETGNVRKELERDGVEGKHLGRCNQGIIIGRRAFLFIVMVTHFVILGITDVKGDKIQGILVKEFGGIQTSWI